jgi:hypothetical protein
MPGIVLPPPEEADPHLLYNAGIKWMHGKIKSLYKREGEREERKGTMTTAIHLSH